MRWPFIACLMLAACGADETFTGYTTPGTYVLTDVNGAPPGYAATLTVAENGAFHGTAPCNTYHGKTDVPYPWFASGPIAATRMACPELTAETAYLTNLQNMTLAEASGNFLILSNDTGTTLGFTLK